MAIHGVAVREDFTEADDEEPPADEHEWWGASDRAFAREDLARVSR